MKTRIMFVDDDKFLLAGLRRLLRSCRDEWDMSFCESGAEAISKLSEQPVDVVVSDMRMPGMDGAQLLEKIQADFPNTVRLILSGQSEQESVFRILGPAHQYLSKPCEVTQLKGAITRAYSISQHLTRDTVNQFMESVDSLPKMPAEVTSLIETLQNPDFQVDEIAERIAQSSFSPVLMKMARSPELAQGRQWDCPRQFIEEIGVDQLKPLLIAASGFTKLMPETTENKDAYDALISHSVTVATTARTIAQAQFNQAELVDQAFTAGLLHDCGKVLFENVATEQFQRARQTAEHGVPLVKAETDEIGITHADAGACLLEQWGLPASIVEAVAFHHQPAKVADAEMSPLIAVHVANAWANEKQECNEWFGDQQVDVDFIASLGLTEAMSQWQSKSAQPVNV